MPPALRKKILVVDDDEQTLRLLRGALEKGGREVLTARRGVRALEILESREGADVAFVIIDLVMPDIDGMELASRIGVFRADLKILIISGYADDVVTHGMHDGFDAGRILFISKPFKINELIGVVESALKA